MVSFLRFAFCGALAKLCTAAIELKQGVFAAVTRTFFVFAFGSGVTNGGFKKLGLHIELATLFLVDLPD